MDTTFFYLQITSSRRNLRIRPSSSLSPLTNSSAALVPPKPKELLIAARAWQKDQ